MDRSKVRYEVQLVTSVMVICMAACSPPGPPAGSGYRPISKSMLIGAEYSHRTSREDWNLTWTFSETEFVITATKGSLPPDLVEAITGMQQNAKHITATWGLHDETLLISNVKIGDETEVAGERTVRIFFTGVIRVQTTGAQYVFSHAMNNAK